MIGTTIDGRYRIERQLGAGAMGSVFLAEHTSTGRKVAVKVIGGELARPDLVARFQREAKAAGAIDTQYITQVLDSGVDPATNMPYLAMEALSGEDLQQAIKRLGPLPVDVTLRIIAQACLGLQKAHEVGVVHRDIKPANLFLARRDGGERMVKLLDFGVAKVKMDHAQDAENAALTKTGSILGSPLFMSPEQARGSKDIDHRADIWSIGVVMYQALTGRSPFQHCTALGELILAINSQEPPPVQQFAPWIPPEVAAIVHATLRRDPAERFQSAGDMYNAIRALLPNGITLTEEMLVPLAQQARQNVGAHFSVPPPSANRPLSVPPPALRTQAPMPGSIPPPAGTGFTGMPLPSPARTGFGSSAGIDTASGGNTGAGLAQTKVTSPSQKSGRWPIIVAAAALALIVSAGVYGVGRTQAQAPATQASAPAIATTTAAIVATAPPPATEVAKPPAPAEAPIPAGHHRVQVVIVPADAAVDVEGAAVTLKDGSLALTGTLGSVHRVHVVKGKQETTVDVVVSESGASPPKIELGAPPGKAAASAAASAAPKVAPKGINTSFDK